MASSGNGEDRLVLVLICGIFIVAGIAFWPLMTVLIWTIALAAALMPFHRRLSRMVKPSASATFLTLWVLLVILAVLSAAANVIYSDIQYVGTMAGSLIRGFEHTGLATFLPPLSAAQLNDMPRTIVQMLLSAVTSSGSNPLLIALQIIIFFLLLSMLLFYGEEIWISLVRPLPDTVQSEIGRLAEIANNTIYSLIIIQISAAAICFTLAVPFFTLLGYGHVLLFSTMIGLAMLVPLIGAQVFLLFFLLYTIALGDFRSAALVVLIGYPLLSGWIDFYYRPVMMGKRVAVHPVFMMIGIFGGVPFMGPVGFILGPVLVALMVTGFKIYAEHAGIRPPPLPGP